jgi:hypothetical protein
MAQSEQDSTQLISPVAYQRGIVNYSSYKLLLGLNFQGSSREGHEDVNRRLLEVGVHRMLHSDDPHHPSSVLAYGFSTEFELRPHPIIGFKAGAWASVWLLEFGLNTIYYTDFSHTSLKVRPEFGIGGQYLKLTMGYNVPMIRNTQFERIRYADMQITLAAYLGLKKTVRKLN